MRASPVKRAFTNQIANVVRTAAARLLVGALAVAGPLGGAARANNGIPGSLAILLPLDKPQEIGLATNFGLILSDDGGATWSWTCEQLATSMANISNGGPPPADRVFALSQVPGLAVTHAYHLVPAGASQFTR